MMDKVWAEGLETDRAVELVGYRASALADADGNIRPRKRYSRDATAAAGIAASQIGEGHADYFSLQRLGCKPLCARHGSGEHRFGMEASLSGQSRDGTKWDASGVAWNTERPYPYSAEALATCRALLQFDDEVGGPDVVIADMERDWRESREEKAS